MHINPNSLQFYSCRHIAVGFNDIMTRLPPGPIWRQTSQLERVDNRLIKCHLALITSLHSEDYGTETQFHEFLGCKSMIFDGAKLRIHRKINIHRVTEMTVGVEVSPFDGI